MAKAWLEESPSLVSVLDLGANEGAFSQLTAQRGMRTIATDADPSCINNLYLKIRGAGEKNIQPLIIDLANPSPAIGLNNQEHASFIQRTHAGLVMALALIHHLAIGKNIPFDRIAGLFSSFGRQLMIEFVPKDDSKVRLMLSAKKDIYPDYTQENFEKAFSPFYQVTKKETIAGSGRTLYLMTAHEK
jgi:hypothetical protein